MSRLGRIVIAGLPDHVTQRGNRRQPVFFAEGDYARYRDILAERCRNAAVAVWAYCLMPNRAHLIMAPQSADGLAERSAKRPGNTLDSSTPARAGPGTCCRGDWRPCLSPRSI